MFDLNSEFCHNSLQVVKGCLCFVKSEISKTNKWSSGWKMIEVSCSSMKMISSKISVLMVSSAKEKKSVFALTQLSLTLHYRRRIFYYQLYILI